MSTNLARKQDDQKQDASMLEVISRAASNPEVDVTKMERLFAMQERIVLQRAETAFNDAMSKAQAEMRRVAADSNNPQTRSQYASYGAIDRVLRPIYTEHGFSISFDTEDSPKEDHVRMIAIVAHKDGFTSRRHADIPADGKGAKGGDVMTKTHAFGAATTYGMRYLLKMVFNVAMGEDDTDGNAEPDPTPGYLLKHNAALREHFSSVYAIKDGIWQENLSAAAEAWFELTDEDKRALWIAPSKGGCFTTEERRVMQLPEFRKAFYGDSEDKEKAGAEAST